MNRNTSERPITVNINGITTLSRRNKPKEQCNEDWKRHALLFLEKAATSVNCRHPHINTSHHLTACSKISELSRFTWEYARNYTSPCVEVINANIGVYWDEMWSKDGTRITINVQFLVEKYQEIAQVRHIKYLPYYLSII